MSDETSPLIPSDDRAIFLLTMPPRSFRNHDHKCIQIQRVVRVEGVTDLRIKPIFNLEYHRLFATSIIELEDDDAKIAEFHPTRPQHILPVAPKGLRSRAFSIENKNGENGGRITFQKNFHGLNGDITVVGSEAEGLFRFESPGTEDLVWRLDRSGQTVEWKLQSADHLALVHPKDQEDQTHSFSGHPNHHLGSPVHGPHDLTGAELSAPVFRRTKTNLTTASQYTTAFANESQLSGLTTSPQMSQTDLITADRQGSDATVLSSLPVPHIKLELSQLDTADRSMTRQDQQIYRILICALWLTWCSPELLNDPEQQNRVIAPIDQGVSESETRSDNSPTHDAAKTGTFDRKYSRRGSRDTAKSDETVTNTKKGLMQRLARVCGSSTA